MNPLAWVGVGVNVWERVKPQRRVRRSAAVLWRVVKSKDPAELSRAVLDAIEILDPKGEMRGVDPDSV